VLYISLYFLYYKFEIWLPGIQSDHFYTILLEIWLFAPVIRGGFQSLLVIEESNCHVYLV